MDRKLTVKFFHIEYAERNNVTFEQCLQRIDGMTQEERELDMGEYSALVETVELGRRTLTGDVIRLQRSNLPHKKRRGNRSQPLGLQALEQLAHPCAFAFDQRTNVLAYQTTRNSVSANKFITYITAKCRVDGVSVYPVLHPDAWERFQTMQPRSFEVQVAQVANLEAIEPRHAPLAQAVSFLRENGHAPKVSFSISMGRRKGSLARRFISRLAQNFLAVREDDEKSIDRLVASGKHEETGEAMVLDLIKAHMKQDRVIDLPDNNVGESFELRKQFALQCLREKREELEAQFLGEND